jgi:nicotinamide-nucleotide amidase
MLIEIVTIGNEIIDGQTVNTNAAFLSRELTERGYDISRHTVLPDESDFLLQGLKEALSRSTLVVTTGGLGPTMDDLTKRAATRLFRTSLQTDSAVYDDLRSRYGADASLQEQSRVPQGAIVLSNHIGTAPGFLFLSAEGSLLLLPGEPREMEHMFYHEAAPLLAEHFSVSPKTQTLSLFFCLLREMELDPILREIQHESPDAKIGIYPSLGSLHVRFSVAKNFERLDHWAKRLREAFPTHLVDQPLIHEAVHSALIERKKTLALAESCTGGALAARLVSLPDASKYLLGSLVVYSKEWKEQFLNVKASTIEKEGAVSRETVKEMAQNLLQKTKADYAIAVAGIAGPSSQDPSIPVGTIYLAVGERSGPIDIGKIMAPPERTAAIEFAVQFALGVLWRRLAYQKLTFL